MKTKCPANIMVFSLITNNGKVLPTHILPTGTRVTTAAYVDLLEKVVVPWLASRYPPDTKLMCIQDSAVKKNIATFSNGRGRQGLLHLRQPTGVRHHGQWGPY